MKGYSSLVACNNAICLIIFILFLSYSLNIVDGMRPLKNQPSPSSFMSLMNSQAYSGPSHRGRGHWSRKDFNVIFICFLSIYRFDNSVWCLSKGQDEWFHDVYLEEPCDNYTGSPRICLFLLQCSRWRSM